MAKISSILLISILYLSLLSACGITGSNENKENTMSTATAPSSPYRQIYAPIVDAQTDNALFSFIYLDDDDIPELVVCDMYYGWYSIYTIKEDSPFCLVDSMNTVEMTYFKQTGIISSFARWNGGGDEGGYGKSYYQISKSETLTDDSIPLLQFSYNAIYDENGTYTGEGNTEYYYMGENTDETFYQEMLASLKAVEDRETVCLENAFEAEEMPSLSDH